jgi:4-hydroxythreonine-4-phosphate dehydrogenase
MGRVAALCFAHAYELVAAGQVQGVAAAPMNKQAFHLAGYNYFDELEYLAEITNSLDAHMLGTVGAFWTLAVTAHVPFRSIPDLITKDRVLLAVRRLAGVLQRTGHAEPRIAVAALNVHGGEGGLFGREELDEIGPAVEEAQQLGLRVIGPAPADTVFVRAREGEFDGVVAMYHDQANIARKLLATRKGATVYMGLPVVCTTTAHGTAFDKAWQGVAEAGSVEDALKYAVDLAS